MSIALVQAVNATMVSSSVVSNTFTSSVTVGNLLIAQYEGQWTYSRKLTIVDTLGNAWIPIYATLSSSSGQQSNAWYTFANASGANTVTVSGANNSYGGVALAEFSGIVGIDQITVPITQYGATSSPLHTNTSNPVTTRYAHELLISFGCIAGAGYPGGAGGTVIAPMSLLANIEWTGGPDWFGQMGYQIVSSIQTGYTAQMGIGSNNADIQLTTFYGDASLPSTVEPPYQLTSYHVDVVGGATNPVIEAALMPDTADMYAVFAYAAQGQSIHDLPLETVQAATYENSSCIAITATLTPAHPNEWAFFTYASYNQLVDFDPGPGWTLLANGYIGQDIYTRYLPSVSPITAAATLTTFGHPGAGVLALFQTNGSTPAILQTAQGGGAFGTVTPTFGSALTPGSTLIAVVSTNDTFVGSITTATVTDTYGNVWTQVGFTQTGGVDGAATGVWACFAPNPSTLTVSITILSGISAGGSSANGWVFEVSNIVPGLGNWTSIGPTAAGQGVFAQTVSAIAPIGAVVTLGTPNVSASATIALIPTASTPAIIQSASSATPITGANAGFGWRAVFTSPVSTSNGVIGVLTISDAVHGGLLWANPVDDTNQWYQVGIAPNTNLGAIPAHSASVFVWWCPSPLSGTQTLDVMAFDGPSGGGFTGTWSIYEVSGLKVPTIPKIVEKIVTAVSPAGTIGPDLGQQGTAPISITGTPAQGSEWLIYLGSGQNSNQDNSVPWASQRFLTGRRFMQV